jgi:hypothetical protein
MRAFLLGFAAGAAVVVAALYAAFLWLAVELLGGGA